MNKSYCDEAEVAEHSSKLETVAKSNTLDCQVSELQADRCIVTTTT